MKSAVKATGIGLAGAIATQISMNSWPAAAVAGAIIIASTALLSWVLASDSRTGRILSIIAALRVERR